MRAGKWHPDSGAAEPLDRLAVETLRCVALVEQRSRARCDPERPVRAAGTADLLEPQQRRRGAFRVAGPDGGLDELGRHPGRDAQLVRVPHRLLRGGERVLVATEAVEEHRARPLGGDQPQPLAPVQHFPPAFVDERDRLGLISSPGGQRDRTLGRQMAAGRLGDRFGLDDERRRRRQVADEELPR